MTVINRTELAQLTRLDQALMWSIVSINNSNLDSKNTFISDNAAIRAESKDYISWSVVQDDKGQGRFVFSALLPIVNPHPLQDKQSIIERIWSYSPYDPQMITQSGIVGYGWRLPTIPSWCNTTERLLAYLAIIATKIVKYASITTFNSDATSTIYSQYWGDCQYQITDTPYGGTMTITGSLTLNWNSYLSGKSLIRCLNPWSEHANDVSCNFPDLAQLWNITAVDLDLPHQQLLAMVPAAGGIRLSGGSQIDTNSITADGLINSYSQANFVDEAVPDWYLAALNGYQSQADSRNNTSSSIGNTSPKIIESLTICKEQDPDLASYSLSLADKVSVK